MQVQAIDNINFESKRTYLQRSQQAVTKLEKDYFKSLHSEAMARRAYLDYRKAEFSLSDFDEGINSAKDVWAVVKILVKMVRKKLSSIIYENDALCAFPNRFAEPDNKLANPWRHYRLKSFSGNSLPSQIKTY